MEKCKNECCENKASKISSHSNPTGFFTQFGYCNSCFLKVDTTEYLNLLKTEIK